MTYELLYIIPSGYVDSEIPALQEKVVKLLDSQGAKVSHSQPAGKLKHAYPMKHGRYGHYVLVRFDADESAIGQIREQLRLSGDIARFQILAGAQGEGQTRILSFDDARLRAREERTAVPRAPLAAPPAAAPAPMVKSGLSAEDLDKKIDEMLSEAA